MVLISDNTSASRALARMQQDDHLAQKIIGTPAHLLEVRSHRAVAFIDIPGTESLQPTVSLKLMQQVAFRHRARTVELKSPHIALSGLGKDLLKTQWQAPTVLILGKGIAAMCITDGHPDRAFASPVYTIPLPSCAPSAHSYLWATSQHKL